MNLDVLPKTGIAFHGYSLTAESLFPIVIPLVQKYDYHFYIYTLPGHTPLLNFLNVLEVSLFLKEIQNKHTPSLFIGHSLGALIGAPLTCDQKIFISPPLYSSFEPLERKEILTYLNPRKVKESQPMSGLVEILNQAPLPAQGGMVLYGSMDLKTVAAIETHHDYSETHKIKIKNAHHTDILLHSQTLECIEKICF